jgi:hypothetical protein
MIKAHNQKTSPCESICYEEASEPTLGIVFEKRDGSRRFAQCAFLSAVDYNGENELTFHFSISAIIVRGENLERIWRATCKGDLAHIRENEKPSSSEIVWVREVTFANPDREPGPDLPPFPTVV